VEEITELRQTLQSEELQVLPELLDNQVLLQGQEVVQHLSQL
jgi:hypothetical protein